MRNRLSGFLAILLVTVVVLGILPAIKAQPPAPAMWIDPAILTFDTAYAHVGDKFNVTLWASTATEVFTYQYDVKFDNKQLNVTRARYTAQSTSQWFEDYSTVATGPVIDNKGGTVDGGETLLGADVVPASSGSIIWIEFLIIAAPTSGNVLTSLIDTKSSDSFLLDSNLVILPNITFDHATYTFSSGAPTRHDVAVTGVTLSSDHPNQGDLVSIGVVALNNGTVPETFDVNVTYDGTLIGKQTVTSLAAGSTQSLTFSWNTSGVAAGDYTITATAVTVAGEADLTNNAKTATAKIRLPETLPEDINGDGKVDMKDIGIVGRAFGTIPGQPRWNPDADLSSPHGKPDGKIDLFDIAAVAQHFWKY